MTIEELNTLSHETFIETFGGIFEHSAWVAERAWSARPFASRDALHAAMKSVVAAADPAEQLALLRAHPDLGARARMSDVSQNEQAGAGLDRLVASEFERLQTLNSSYRQKFGFPFLYAVKGSTKHDILQALDRRLSSDPATEYTEALEQVYRIAGFRLENKIC